jgi:hypothetical protein
MASDRGKDTVGLSGPTYDELPAGTAAETDPLVARLQLRDHRLTPDHLLQEEEDSGVM